MKSLSNTHIKCKILIYSYSYDLQRQILHIKFQQRHDGHYMLTTQRYSCAHHI
jgi:hypothetical protein